MDWRVLFLDLAMKRRAQSRFKSHLKKAKSDKDKDTEANKKLLRTEDIPWTGISPEIFNVTCYDMEIAALKLHLFSLSKACAMCTN